MIVSISLNYDIESDRHFLYIRTSDKEKNKIECHPWLVEQLKNGLKEGVLYNHEAND